MSGSPRLVKPQQPVQRRWPPPCPHTMPQPRLTPARTVGERSTPARPAPGTPGRACRTAPKSPSTPHQRPPPGFASSGPTPPPRRPRSSSRERPNHRPPPLPHSGPRSHMTWQSSVAPVSRPDRPSDSRACGGSHRIHRSRCRVIRRHFWCPNTSFRGSGATCVRCLKPDCQAAECREHPVATTEKFGPAGWMTTENARLRPRLSAAWAAHQLGERGTSTDPGLAAGVIDVAFHGPHRQ